MKIIKVDDVEIEYQKQNTDCDSKWCVFVKVRQKDHDKILFMIKELFLKMCSIRGYMI